MGRQTRMKGALLAAALGAASAIAAAEDGLTLSTGFDYSRGNYGASTQTEVTYIPLTAKYETGPWTLKMTVPWLSITGPGSVVGSGDDIVVLPTTNTARTTNSGPGDIVAGAAYTVVERPASGLVVDVIGKIKFATADADKGLGTGKNDYAFQTDVVKAFGNFSALGTLGYKVMGDPPGLNLRNVWYGSLGGGYKVSPTFSAGGLLDLRQSSVDGGRKQRELTFYAAYKLGTGTRLQAYVVKGLAEGSPDLSVGASLGARF